ncbi:hypothetical protein ZHAS_00008829 [Anopheles sinensis]|uniref:Uncharacterized protein n=1 Tax=Anopheles sinensis TaxID=74873 RepID=A0A084VTE7_ANOSI|nr:hypothetical protein ZHAS_00008829 [Anopheles sinensis]
MESQQATDFVLASTRKPVHVGSERVRVGQDVGARLASTRYQLRHQEATGHRLRCVRLAGVRLIMSYRNENREVYVRLASAKAIRMHAGGKSEPEIYALRFSATHQRDDKFRPSHAAQAIMSSMSDAPWCD